MVEDGQRRGDGVRREHVRGRGRVPVMRVPRAVQRVRVVLLGRQERSNKIDEERNEARPPVNAAVRHELCQQSLPLGCCKARQPSCEGGGRKGWGRRDSSSSPLSTGPPRSCSAPADTSSP